MSNNCTHQQARVTFDIQDVLTISILTVIITSIKKSINHDNLLKRVDHQWRFFMWTIEIGCTSYEFIPGFQVRLTRSLILCVCFVDRCLSFCTFLLWPLYCLFFFDIRILITTLVFTNSSILKD
jgi:hypothetical protein